VSLQSKSNEYGDDRALIADLLLGRADAGVRFVERFGGLIRSVIRSLDNLSNEDKQDLEQDCYSHILEANCKVLGSRLIQIQ
jgi:hypothetical protein